MLQPTLVTWIIIIFGIITFVPLLVVQLIVILQPHSKKTRDLVIGKDQEWRDKTHFKSAYAFAWADWIFFIPVLVAGIIGIVLAQNWGYALFAVAGAISAYINIFLYFFEKEYVYPTAGPLVYFTYFWGNFVYWGLAALVYSVLRLSGVSF
jgi:hypothetical protein